MRSSRPTLRSGQEHPRTIHRAFLQRTLLVAEKGTWGACSKASSRGRFMKSSLSVRHARNGRLEFVNCPGHIPRRAAP